MVPSKPILYLSFFAVYILWGANYIGVHFAIESIPPVLMGGTRFFVAGILLFGIAQWMGEKLPKLQDTRLSILQSLWLIAGTQGLLAWGQLYVPSSIAAIIMATVPIWIVVIDFRKWSYHFTHPAILLGLVLGLLGVYYIFKPNVADATIGDTFIYGFIAMLISALCWSFGTLYAQKVELQVGLITNVSIQMIVGGLILLGVGIGIGEMDQFSLAQVSIHSILGLAHLIFFGSIICYLAYFFLLKTQSAVGLTSYSYVHPVVAIALGVLLANDPISLQTILAVLMILSAVFLINFPDQVLRFFGMKSS